MKIANLTLISILLLAAGLRLYKIGTVPIGLFGDEIDNGYNAFSISRTLKDYNGNWLPIHTESMEDRRPALYAWSVAPWVGLLGLSDFSARLPSAVYGVIEVGLVYWLVNLSFLRRKESMFLSKIKVKLQKDKFRDISSMDPRLRGDDSRKWIPILCAFILAIVPWHVHFSRIALEAVWTQMLLVLGVGCLIKSSKLISQNSKLKLKFIKQKTNRHLYWLIAGTVVLGLNAYSYQAAKLISPFLFGLTVASYWKSFNKLSKKIKLAIVGLLVIILIPLYFDSFFRGGQDRFNSINVLNTPGLVADVNYARGQMEGQPEWVKKVFYNKVLSASYELGNNYLSSFSPGFLFAHGDDTNPRHSVPGFGMLYWWTAPFTALGLFGAWSKKREAFWRLMLLWLVSVPLASAVTVGGSQHGIRLFSMLLPLVIITGMGIWEGYEIAKNNIYWVGLTVLSLFSVVFYGQEYLYHYSQTVYQDWQYGFKQAVNYVDDNGEDYDQIIITRSYVHLPMLHYVFYSQYPPAQLHKLFAGAKKGLNPPPTDEIGKVSFATINPGDSYKPKNTLYVASPADRREGWILKGQVNSPDPMNKPPVLLYLSSE